MKDSGGPTIEFIKMMATVKEVLADKLQILPNHNNALIEMKGMSNDVSL